MRFFIQLLIALVVAAANPVQADDQRIGMVVMHGKGGMPTRHVAGLAAGLERHGVLVANLEMPWSAQRNYDVDVATAEAEVAAAVAGLRQKGAAKVFVGGHSQGGLFALHFGGRYPVDGIVAIAPGGNVGNATFRERLGESLELARNLIKEGRGQEKARLMDFENAKGTYPVVSPPAAYVTWFEPDGAMNQTRAVQAIRPKTPVLFIVPTQDYPGLQRVKDAMFGQLPKHPLTRLYEPSTNHLGAPEASVQEIFEWTQKVSVN